MRSINIEVAHLCWHCGNDPERFGCSEKACAGIICIESINKEVGKEYFSIADYSARDVMYIAEFQGEMSSREMIAFAKEQEDMVARDEEWAVNHPLDRPSRPKGETNTRKGKQVAFRMAMVRGDSETADRIYKEIRREQEKQFHLDNCWGCGNPKKRFGCSRGCQGIIVIAKREYFIEAMSPWEESCLRGAARLMEKRKSAWNIEACEKRAAKDDRWVLKNPKKGKPRPRRSNKD